MSLLTLTQTTARLLGIPVPTEVVNSTDTQVQQLLALANEEGQELARDHDWQILTKQKTFLTVADPEQTGAVPTDWARFIPNSFYNRTTLRPVFGPITPQQWQAIQAYPQMNLVYLAFRQRDGAFLMTPTPPADDEIAYEYVGKDWVETMSGATISEFTADSDEPLLEQRLFELGVRWRFLKSKGLDYAEDFRTYEYAKQRAMADDGGATRLNVTGRSYFNPFGYPQLPLGNWPSS